jgi:hypothetical protein
MKILTFGKHKNEMLEMTPESYIKWLAAHRNVLSVEHRDVSDAAKAMLAPVAAPVVVEEIEEPLIETSAPVVVEVAPVERATRFDRDLCCMVYSDNGERVTPQIFVEGLGWVSPPGSEEVIDVEEGLSWSYAVRRSNSKARMRADINATKRSADVGMRGSFGSKPFSILKV